MPAPLDSGRARIQFLQAVSMRTLPLAALWALIFLSSAVPAPAAFQAPARASEGMVVSGHRLASAAGVETLRQGGNAVDAIVATAFVMAVVSPKDGNLGGGGFLVTRGPEGAERALDFREIAPRGAHRDLYLNEKGEVVPRLSLDGWLAVGVPGAVAGYLKAAEGLGSKSVAELLAPAITLARDGFVLDARDAALLQGGAERLSRDPGATAIFVRQDRPWAAGDRFRQPELAQTLEQIAAQGQAGFYAGPTAQCLAAAMAAKGGLLDEVDLARYRAVWRQPLVGSYRGRRIISMPPPSSGGVALLQMLAMIEAFPVAELGAGSSALIHLQAEAGRRAFADRSKHLGDPDHWPVPVAELLDPAYLRQRMGDFDPDRASLDIEPSQVAPPESDHTTHISIVDRWGGAAAMTVTLNSSFGAAVVAPGTGFLLNNEMDDFSAKPGVPNQFGLVGAEANAIAPGKRPLSSMTPTIMTRGDRVELVVGSPGGARIISTVFQVILNIFDLGMDVQAAVSWPRTHHQWRPNQLRAEPFALSADVAAALEAHGHQLDIRDEPWSRADAVHVRGPGQLEGGADPRGEHVALGLSDLSINPTH